MTPIKSAAAREDAPCSRDHPARAVHAGENAGAEPARPSATAAGPARRAAPTPMVVKRRRTGGTRFVLLVVVPLVALALGFAWWLSGGRYVTTDNAYVGADKVLITPAGHRARSSRST